MSTKPIPKENKDSSRTADREEPLLEVQNLHRHFSRTDLKDIILQNRKDPVQAVDGVSFSVNKGEVQGIIGESGCGKTTLLHNLIGLQKPQKGKIIFEGRDMTKTNRNNWRSFRKNVSLIFQDPFNSLDPKMSIEDVLREPLEVHNIGDKENRIREKLRYVELQPAGKYLDKFPRQLSGGELQRVSIARALMTNPQLLLADEPVSMLDVSIQAAILNLLEDLVDELGLSILYISHDISTVGQICETLNVMYLGRIVERGSVQGIINDPKHPYSQELIRAVPIPDPNLERERSQLDSNAPDPIGLGEGCRFRDRCPERMDICEKTPREIQLDDGRVVACHLHYDHTETEGGKV